jgi:hypothetical protein
MPRRLAPSVALLTEVFVEVIVRMMVLLFWITYNRCSEHLILLHETPDDVYESLHVAWHVQKDKGSAVCAGNMEVFSVSYVIGFIARQVLRGVSCDEYRMYLTSEVLLPNVFKYFKSSVIQSSLSPNLRSWSRLLVLLEP